MAEQRVNAQGETVEFNEDSQRWEPVKEVETEQRESDDTEEFDVDVDDSEDEGKPVSFDYAPRTDK